MKTGNKRLFCNRLQGIAVCILLCCGTATAQQPAITAAQVADKLEAYYNASQYDSIFQLLSPSFQQHLPADQCRQFFARTYEQMKSIMRKEPEQEKNNIYSYKVYFEGGVSQLRFALDSNAQIAGLVIKPYEPPGLSHPERNTTALTLPFSGTWFVAWGGDTREQNYHVESRAQKNAFDLLMTDSTGATHRREGKNNSDYYAFGQPIFAPCAGTIVLVVDGVKDNIPGEMNGFNIGGNMVILKTPAAEYLVFCHLQHASITVKEGQPVKAGTVLGLCGNSGHSSEPHLHFHIQNTEDMNYATGIKSFFSNIKVNGQPRTDYSPVREELISNP